MTFLKAVVVLFILYPCPFAAAVSKNLAMNDAVFCSPEQNKPFSGLYALDFVVNLPEEALAPEEVGKNTTSLIEGIISHLDKTISALGASLRDFYQHYKKRKDDSLDIWESKKNNLPRHDEEASLDLPENCKDNVLQVITRTEFDSGIKTFECDQKSLVKIRKKGAIQESMIIVHQWLRSYSSDPLTIAKVNRFLHSVKFQNFTDKELKAWLTNAGLTQAREMETQTDVQTDIEIKEKFYALSLPAQRELALAIEKKNISLLNSSVDHICKAENSTEGKDFYFYNGKSKSEWEAKLATGKTPCLLARQAKPSLIETWNKQ